MSLRENGMPRVEPFDCESGAQTVALERIRNPPDVSRCGRTTQRAGAMSILRLFVTHIRGGQSTGPLADRTGHGQPALSTIRKRTSADQPTSGRRKVTELAASNLYGNLANKTAYSKTFKRKKNRRLKLTDGRNNTRNCFCFCFVFLLCF